MYKVSLQNILYTSLYKKVGAALVRTITSIVKSSFNYLKSCNIFHNFSGIRPLKRRNALYVRKIAQYLGHMPRANANSRGMCVHIQNKAILVLHQKKK